MKWSLTDWPIAVMRHNAPWIQGRDKRIYESRFGLYAYDGTLRGRPMDRIVRADAGATTNRGLLVRTSDSGPTTHWSHQLRINAAGQFEQYAWTGAASTVAGTTVVQPDAWYYVVGVAENGGPMRLFVNGLEEGTAINIGALWSGGDRWMVGSDSDNGMGYFAGVMDEVSIFSYALSPEEVYSRYLSVVPEPCTLALLAAAAAGLGAYVRRRRRKA